MNYDQFLEGKIKVADKTGIKISAGELHESSKPHQIDTILWALELGRALLALECGMGKSHIQIEILRILNNHFGGKYLIVTELGVTQEFCDPEIGEGARLGINLEYVTCQEEAFQSDCNIVVTNYERVRNGEFDFSAFAGVCLDEGSYLKNMASETTESLKNQLAKVKFKFIATATPSPNETLELINYSHVLGVCDRGQILTRFFQRNSQKAGELTIHPQHEDDFWLWVSSWTLFITQPSDLGHSNEGYALPPLNVRWHEVNLNKAIDAGIEKDGQAKMFRVSCASLQDAAKIKRESIAVRIDKAMDIMFGLEADNDHYIIWHHLEDERRALNAAMARHPSYGDIYGSQQWPIREKRVIDFSKGELAILATKPEISGVGCNFQKHCNRAIFLGIDYSFEIFYQALRRIYRFGQTKPVEIDILYCPEEYEIVNVLKEKWELHNEQREKMREIVLKYGLNHSKYIEEKRRSFKQDRKVYKGENYELICTDAVHEWQQRPDNSIDMILTSIPFGNHYEYTDKYNDFGHNVTNADFFKQMDFLLPHLLRVLKPGRIAAFHTKNRIHYGSVTGLGFSIMHRFTHAACECFERNGFHCMGFHYVPTDVVAENNQTYRLGYTEACKDMTKMGAGIPEEIWVFRKAPTSNMNAYADEPVIHDNAYTLSNWQVDADSFWKSSGNRYLTPYEMKAWGLDKIQAWWKKFNKEIVYDYDQHVELLQALDKHKKLSRTFTTLPLQSNTANVWNDVNRMHGLNMEQSRRKQQNHICPMPFDEVDRLIELYSNPGDTIADPFGGLCTTGVRSIKKGRKAIITELNEVYAKAGAYYLNKEEQKVNIPTLFDLLLETA